MTHAGRLTDAMMDTDLARAESQLARLDREGAPTIAGSDASGITLGDGFHLESDDEAEDADEEHVGFDGLAPLVDAFNEAFNARDLDGVLEVLAEDAEVPGLASDIDDAPSALQDLWTRRPTSMLTRGDLDGRVVSVLWEVGDNGSWWKVAPVYVDAQDDHGIGVLEFDDDQETCDAIVCEAPDDEFESGSTWQEWEDGVPAD